MVKLLDQYRPLSDRDSSVGKGAHIAVVYNSLLILNLQARSPVVLKRKLLYAGALLSYQKVSCRVKLYRPWFREAGSDQRCRIPRCYRRLYRASGCQAGAAGS